MGGIGRALQVSQHPSPHATQPTDRWGDQAHRGRAVPKVTSQGTTGSLCPGPGPWQGFPMCPWAVEALAASYTITRRGWSKAGARWEVFSSETLGPVWATLVTY